MTSGRTPQLAGGLARIVHTQPDGGAIRINLPNLAIFLWRLSAYRPPVTKPVFRGNGINAAPNPGDASIAVRFDVHPLSHPVRLFNTPRYDPDRQPRMDETGAYTLIKKALKNYQDEHWHYPGRVVIHKTSTFNKAEQTGTLRALGELQIRSYDLLSVVDTSIRLVRDNY